METKTMAQKIAEQFGGNQIYDKDGTHITVALIRAGARCIRYPRQDYYILQDGSCIITAMFGWRIATERDLLQLQSPRSVRRRRAGAPPALERGTGPAGPETGGAAQGRIPGER